MPFRSPVAVRAAPIVLYVDGDACPVKNEVYRVAERHGVRVVLVSNAPLAVLVYLLLVGKRLTAFMVFVSVAGGTVLSSALKWGIGRPRPDLVPHGMEVYTASFPSGHSTMSAVVYLTLGALLARTQPRWRVKVFLLGLAASVTVIVGISRIYLGVHWPTDVLGGWALGAGWACLCWLALLWLQMRGEVEPEGKPPAEGNGG